MALSQPLPGAEPERGSDRRRARIRIDEQGAARFVRGDGGKVDRHDRRYGGVVARDREHQHVGSGRRNVEIDQLVAVRAGIDVGRCVAVGRAPPAFRRASSSTCGAD